MAANRGPEGLGRRVEDHADGGDPIDGEAEGDAGVGEAVDKVDGAIDGIHDEGGRVGEGFLGIIGLFAVESTWDWGISMIVYLVCLYVYFVAHDSWAYRNEMDRRNMSM